MMINEKLWNICVEIYRQAYREASPPANFDALCESGVTDKPRWYMEYYLDGRRQKEIVDVVCARHNLSRGEKRKVIAELFDGAMPWRGGRQNN